GLGRVNLLVGTNNCGKTSILEAIHVLARAGDLRPLLQTLVRRGELADNDGDLVEINRVVHGHRFGEGAAFAVYASNDTASQDVKASFVSREVGADVPPRIPRRPGRYSGESDETLELSPFDLRIDWHRGDDQVTRREVQVMRGGGVIRRRSGLPPDEGTSEQVQFISTDGLSRDEVVVLFEAAVLTDDEAVVLQALRTVEPGIERLASVGFRQPRPSRRGGIDMLVASQRLPIGSMGDGIWRLLGIALALVRARGGILLVDEIDTGLHYTVLTKMWRLVFETAKRLDVQVFATTHSRDCYEALAEVTVADRHEISLQRIERERPEAVAFTEGELRVAAERGLEVR
ncbi:MAG: ATP-binding protein, partial [Rhodoglobus sp.]